MTSDDYYMTRKFHLQILENVNTVEFRMNSIFPILVSVPKIVNVSKDLTGANGNKPFKLHCKATGIPQPSYSWLLDGRPVHPTSAVQMNGETLTISKPHPLRHEGEYRCVASNVWGSVLSRPIQVQLSRKNL